MRVILARVLLAAAALGAILAAWAYFTGGFRVRLLGIPLSVRGADRAAYVTLAFAVFAFLVHPYRRRALAALVARWRPRIPSLALPIVLIAAGVVLWAGLTMGSRYAGGADQYGYVTQSELWLKGELRIEVPFAAEVPWPNAEWTLSPLGYRPGGNHTIVPTYSPGYPLLMALFTILFGANGLYYVAPLCGAALVLLTYVLGVRLAGRTVGLVAALCIALSPTVLFFTVSVMSDIPVSAFWTLSLILAMRQTTRAAWTSAVAAGIAILIRPNLAFAALVPMLVVAWPGQDRATSLRRAVTFAAVCVPFAAFIGWLFNELHGSPLRSGYGDSSSLFAFENVAANAAKYSRWLWETQSPLIFLFIASPIAAWGRSGGHRALRWLLVAFTGLIATSYLLYLSFDDWWYLRFLLPVFPVVFVLAADAVWMGAARLGSTARRLAMTLFALTMLSFGLSYSIEQTVLETGEGERRYADVARYLNTVLPLNAVVYSMQHAGPVRYYGYRRTLRYDVLEPDWLDRSIEFLRQAGYEPYLLLDDWEVPMFEERFTSQKYGALVAREPPAVPCTHTTFLYKVAPRPGDSTVVRIPDPHCK